MPPRLFTPDMDIECYSQRLLNPFRGVVNCLRYQSAEAISTDGEHWDIYVSHDALLEGLDNSRRILTSDIRYGNWSADTGLKRGPLYPSEDFRAMEHQGAVVYEQLLAVHERTPFPFRDHCELWLLDQAARPVALLDSCTCATDIDLDQSIAWRAGLACRKTFSSAVSGELPEDTTGEGALAGYLTRYLNASAGASPAAQWFERTPGDDRATGLTGINLPASLQGRRLDAGCFPALFLDTRHRDAVHRQLCCDYLDWQAPWLLLLPTLDRPTRQRLEQAACRQPLVVERQYRLYPEIIDAQAIRAARVEALLRRKQATPKDDDDALSTFYIELHPSPTE